MRIAASLDERNTYSTCAEALRRGQRVIARAQPPAADLEKSEFEKCFEELGTETKAVRNRRGDGGVNSHAAKADSVPNAYRPDAIGPLAGSNFVFTVSSAILSPMSWPTTVEKR